MTMILDIAIPLIQALLGTLTKNQAPQYVLSALNAAIDALSQHQNDIVTKAALEAQRG